MVKTLRITTVVAAMMAAAMFALPIKYGIQTDENVEKFIGAPGVIEEFKATSGNIRQAPSDQVHPLVQQAQAFALILDPPKPEVPTPRRGAPGNRQVTVTPPDLTPKFKVLTTSYYENNPELSMALIDEPGKGKHWIRQSTTVNHLFIEQIKDGVVIVRNGETTFETPIEPKKVVPPAAARTVISPTNTSRAGRAAAEPPVRAPVRSPIIVKNPKTEIDDPRAQRVEELIEKMRLLESQSDDPDNPQASNEEKAAQLQKIINEIRNSNLNISDEEAQNLDDLGEVLDNLESDGSE